MLEEKIEDKKLRSWEDKKLNFRTSKFHLFSRDLSISI